MLLEPKPLGRCPTLTHRRSRPQRRRQTTAHAETGKSPECWSLLARAFTRLPRRGDRAAVRGQLIHFLIVPLSWAGYTRPTVQESAGTNNPTNHRRKGFSSENQGV